MLAELAFMAVTGGTVYWLSVARCRWRLRIWRNAVEASGLRVVESAGAWSGLPRLEARAGPVKVRLEDTRRQGGEDIRVVVVVPGPPGFSRVRICREPEQRLDLSREIEVGDGPFDAAFSIEGPTALVRALLDADTRRLLDRLNRASLVVIGSGELRAETSEKRLASMLPRLLEAGQWFARSLDVAERLAENARSDPEAGVRLQNLLVLTRELGGDAKTAEMLHAACSDPSPWVRLRAAMELGAEGRDVLVEVAESLEDDIASAEAVSVLAQELPFERQRDLLVRSLRRRRLETARACLEALGSSGNAAAVDTLANVMAREQGELAAAAALALGTTGNTAAEPPLILALEREHPDLQVAAASALARVGSTAAVLPLKEAAERSSRDQDLRRATRQAIAEIQSRLRGASPGQLSLAGVEAGQLSLAPAEAGQLSIATDPAGQLSFPPGEPGRLSLTDAQERGPAEP